MSTIKFILSTIIYFSVLGLSAQTIETKDQTNNYSAYAGSKYFIGGSVIANYGQDSGPQGLLEPINFSFGTFDSSTPSTTSTFSFNVNPYLGIRKTQNSSFGVSAHFSLRRDMFGDGSTFSINPGPFTAAQIDFGLGAFYRQDIITKDRLTLFAQYAITYTREHTRNLAESQPSELLRTNDRINILASLGVKFSIHQNWNLIASLISVDFGSELNIQKQTGIKSFNNTLALNSSLSSIRFGVERSF